MYALADNLGMSVGALFGAERRKYIVKLPPKLAGMFEVETIEIEEDAPGMSANEFVFWRAFYEIERDKQKKNAKSR